MLKTEPSDSCAIVLAGSILLAPAQSASPGRDVESLRGRGVETLLAVNGTLMRGLELNGNLLAAGATFVREARTAPVYRLWSIGDRHPAMVRVPTGGAAIAVEVWSVPPAGLTSILRQEPPGLCIGKVQLDDGSEVLGVLGESILCQNQRDITAYGGWRAYVASRATTP
jgi:hypothetical protein